MQASCPSFCGFVLKTSNGTTAPTLPWGRGRPGEVSVSHLGRHSHSGSPKENCVWSGSSNRISEDWSNTQRPVCKRCLAFLVKYRSSKWSFCVSPASRRNHWDYRLPAIIEILMQLSGAPLLSRCSMLFRNICCQSHPAPFHNRQHMKGLSWLHSWGPASTDPSPCASHSCFCTTFQSSQ